MHTKASRLNGVIGWAVMAVFMAITVPAEEARELSNQALTISAPAVTSQLQHLLERRDFGGREVEITDLQGRTLIRSTQSLELQSREALSILDASRVESQVIVRPAGTVLLRLTPEPMDLPGGVAVTRFDEATAAESEGWFQPTLEATPILAALLGGAVGGFSRRFSRNASGGSTGARIAEGLAVAIIAYVAGVLGVSYLGLPVAVVSTEAGAFLTGALSGLAGVTVIELLSKRLALSTRTG